MLWHSPDVFMVRYTAVGEYFIVAPAAHAFWTPTNATIPQYISNGSTLLWIENIRKLEMIHGIWVFKNSCQSFVRLSDFLNQENIVYPCSISLDCTSVDKVELPWHMWHLWMWFKNRRNFFQNKTLPSSRNLITALAILIHSLSNLSAVWVPH